MAPTATSARPARGALCGHHASSFNVSKRVAPGGDPRWPSTAMVSAVIAVLDLEVEEFWAEVCLVQRYGLRTAERRRDETAAAE